MDFRDALIWLLHVIRGLIAFWASTLASLLSGFVLRGEMAVEVPDFTAPSSSNAQGASVSQPDQTRDEHLPWKPQQILLPPEWNWNLPKTEGAQWRGCRRTLLRTSGEKSTLDSAILPVLEKSVRSSLRVGL